MSWTARAFTFGEKNDSTWELTSVDAMLVEEAWEALASHEPAPAEAAAVRSYGTQSMPTMVGVGGDAGRHWLFSRGRVTLTSPRGAETRVDPSATFASRVLRTAPLGTLAF